MFIGIPSLVRGRNVQTQQQLGVFCLSPEGVTITNPVLNNPNVDGISVGQQWADLETSDGVFDWSYLDTQIPRVVAAGKNILLRIGTGGGDATRGNTGWVPGWVIDQIAARDGGTPNDCVSFFHFVDDISGLPDRAIPLFWDPLFTLRRRAMLTALGARYSSVSRIKVVYIGVANARTNDWNVPQNPGPDDLCGVGKSERQRWLDLGYTAQKLIDQACPALPSTGGTIDAAAIAFPNAFIAFTGGRNSTAVDAPSMSGLDPVSRDYSATQMFINGSSKYGSRIILSGEALSQKTHEQQPYSGQPAGDNQWTILYNHPPCGEQMGSTVSNPTGLAKMSGVANGGAAQVLTDAIDEGFNYKPLYQEIYASDITNPDLVDVIAHAHSILLHL